MFSLHFEDVANQGYGWPGYYKKGSRRCVLGVLSVAFYPGVMRAHCVFIQSLMLFRYAKYVGVVWLVCRGTRHLVDWPQSKGGDPTEGQVLGQLLWKLMP